MTEVLFTGTEPYRAHDTDAGFDLYAAHDVELGHGVSKIDTGTHVAIPEGHVGFIMDRSSMGARGFHVFGGVIDCGYTGEITVLLYNTGLPEHVAKGQKVAQLVIVPIFTGRMKRAETLGTTDRGSAGFGSTGI